MQSPTRQAEARLLRHRCVGCYEAAGVGQSLRLASLVIPSPSRMVGLPLLRPCGSRAPAAWTDRSSSSNPGRRRAHSCGSNYQVPARQHPSAAPRRAPCRGAVTADPSSRPGLRHGPGAVAQTVRDGLTARHRGVVTGHRCTCNPSALSQHRHAQSAQTIRDGLAASPGTAGSQQSCTCNPSATAGRVSPSESESASSAA